jgi:recombination protein RecR
MFETISPALEELISNLNRLPGVGRKTAQRLALFLLRDSDDHTTALAQSIIRIKKEIHFCSECFNITEDDLCSICKNVKRDRSIICVVEDIVDIFAIEKSNEYRGLYHVLGGVISPLTGVSPDSLKMNQLVNRVQNSNIQEVVLALNPSTEGEATMIYISRLFRDMDVRVTRIASGIPLGAHLEFIDNATIGRAILRRSEL